MSAPKEAVAQFAARFAFDHNMTQEVQQELAQRIEDAIADFKGGDYHKIVARALQAELRRRIEGEIDSWFLSHCAPQPVEPEENAS